MPGLIEVKRRLKSVKSTKKITRAMQMISAAKMRKAQIAAVQSRTYSSLAWEIITNLAHKVDPKYHALLSQKNNTKKIAVILISTNRGQVGGFNTNLINSVKRFFLDQPKGPEEVHIAADLIVMGRKGREAMVRLGESVIADFPKSDKTIGISEILPISKLITEDYLAGKYSKVVLAYTHYVSTLSQKPLIKQLLPFKSEGDKADPDKHKDLPEHYKKNNFEYLFEPSPDKVLDYLVPRILDSQVYQAILESNASEHSARMIMMKNATDAASDLIEDLTLTYNQVRQANITKELAEITAGRIALE
ncbi:MAG: synthase gamma subunit [Candidatus Doudnabacteria bacterium]|nr:synthase gamma subunit [Candidatus Doudnabacteria bacterium]